MSFFAPSLSLRCRLSAKWSPAPCRCSAIRGRQALFFFLSLSLSLPPSVSQVSIIISLCNPSSVVSPSCSLNILHERFCVQARQPPGLFCHYVRVRATWKESNSLKRYGEFKKAPWLHVQPGQHSVVSCENKRAGLRLQILFTSNRVG